MSTQAIIKVLKQYPTLNFEGLVMPRDLKISAEERVEALKASQEKLLANTEQFEIACKWLSSKEKSKTINKRIGSYKLKHQIEEEFNNKVYISNGVLIAAAVHCGFEIVPFNATSQNAYLNISQESLKQ